VSQEDKQRGRPRVWASAAEKHRVHRARRAEQEALVGELLDAVRNARLEDPGLHREVLEGDDAAVLRALIAYYRARHWCLGRR
jgi:hypothetical protein